MLTINNPSFFFNDLSCLTEQERLERMNRLLKPYFDIARGLINLRIVTIQERYRPQDVESIKLGGKFDFCDDPREFTCDIEIDGCSYFSLTYDPDAYQWSLCAIVSDMGDRDTPPSTDLVDLASDRQLFVIIEEMVKAYKKIIDHQVGDMREAEDYEDSKKFAEEMYHMQYEQR